MLDSKFIITDTLKMLARAACVYLALASIYVHESYAGYCVTFIAKYVANNSGATSNYAINLPVFTTSTAAACASGAYLPTGTEFAAAEGIPSSVQTDINTLNSNINTVNSNLTTLQTTVTGIGDTANQALTVANQALNEGGGGNSTNPDNILNISPEDATTLMYAFLGLLVVAYVGKLWRKSLESNSSYIGD